MATTVNHTFKSELFVPISAISDNFDFLTTRLHTRPRITTRDGVDCVVKLRKTFHLCSGEAQELIWRLYGMSVWEFLMRWYITEPHVTSLEFIYLKIEATQK